MPGKSGCYTSECHFTDIKPKYHKENSTQVYVLSLTRFWLSLVLYRLVPIFSTVLAPKTLMFIILFYSYIEIKTASLKLSEAQCFRAFRSMIIHQPL